MLERELALQSASKASAAPSTHPSKTVAQKRKPLGMNGERRNSVDVIIVCANDTCAAFPAASVISLQKLDT
ncbi:hypothetical protein [Paraburkholderia phenazinium]|uniref:hypothetical protein n=1 Tax=Paraburkholderia phenazinium TaxID=60549 RepID=UPI00115F7B28|nr:hypothetical protein [Paraburkholderia phenazinium]